MHFQPKVDPISGTVMGAEALARWTHPERGAIPPSTFIPVAEQTGLIIPLTFHVLHEAMRQAGAWYAADLELDISVNVSARALLERTMPARIEGLLRFHQLPAHRLILEVTESAMLAESDNVVPVLERLVALGVTISVDDFGTGFSSLEYLKRLPVGELKIDRSFVLGLATDERDARDRVVRCGPRPPPGAARRRRGRRVGRGPHRADADGLRPGAGLPLLARRHGRGVRGRGAPPPAAARAGHVARRA